VSAQAESVSAIADQLAGSVARFVRDERLPGAAVGVVVGDELAWSFGHGFADVEAERPSTPDGLYRIASITKTFTATAIMQLRDEGKLALDDPAVSHLPELADIDDPFAPVETITLRRLLSHESGLMSDPPGTEWASRTYETNVKANLAASHAIRGLVPPSSQTKYSNLAFQLLGEVVTRASGTPYGDYVMTNILEPLGMSSTAFEPPPPELAGRCVTGYAPRVLNDRLTPAVSAGPPHSPVAEGGLWSCVDDLARWVSAQFRTDGERGGDRVLSGASLREMHRPRYLAASSLREMRRPRHIYSETWTEAFCIGWYARRRGEETWIGHSGGLPGFITNVCFHREDRVGVIVLLNGHANASDLAIDLGDLALTAARGAVEPATIPEPLPSAYEPLLGLYTNDDWSLPAGIEWRDGSLTFFSIQDPEWRFTLSATADPWTFVVDPGFRESGESVVFERTGDGRVRAVLIASDRLVRLGPVEDVS
jgi:CubicO group peptidase (beta-lactamase class C family)